jgi:hypothetical protein
MQYYMDSKRHIICIPYTVKNLHAMAKALRIPQCWFHSSKDHPHYDAPKMRVNELKAHKLITVVSQRELLRLLKSQRVQLPIWG